jgi:hypothetical protein
LGELARQTLSTWTTRKERAKTGLPLHTHILVLLEILVVADDVAARDERPVLRALWTETTTALNALLGFRNFSSFRTDKATTMNALASRLTAFVCQAVASAEYHAHYLDALAGQLGRQCVRAATTFAPFGSAPIGDLASDYPKVLLQPLQIARDVVAVYKTSFGSDDSRLRLIPERYSRNGASTLPSPEAFSLAFALPLLRRLPQYIGVVAAATASIEQTEYLQAYCPEIRSASHSGIKFSTQELREERLKAIGNMDKDCAALDDLIAWPFPRNSLVRAHVKSPVALSAVLVRHAPPCFLHGL